MAHCMLINYNSTKRQQWDFKILYDREYIQLLGLVDYYHQTEFTIWEELKHRNLNLSPCALNVHKSFCYPSHCMRLALVIFITRDFFLTKIELVGSHY